MSLEIELEDADFTDDMYTDYHPSPQQSTLRCLSQWDEPIEPFQSVPAVTYDYDKNIKPLKAAMKDLGVYDMSNFIPPDFDEPLQDPLSFSELVNDFHRILSHHFMPVNVVEKQNIIGQSMSLPVRAVINTMMPRMNRYRVLILGVGSGRDPGRLTEVNPTITELVCVDPVRKKLDKIKEDYPTATCLWGTPGSKLDEYLTLGPYDVILSNMTLHHFASVPSGQNVIDMLPRLLTPNGFFFGSYIDIPGVKASSMAQYLKTGGGVMYLGESSAKSFFGEAPLNGIASISMAGVVWEDPYVTIEQLYSMTAKVPVNMNIYHGSTMVQGPKDGSPLFKTPKGCEFLLRRPELKLYRGVLITRQMDPVTQPSGTPAWLKSIDWCGEADAQLCVPSNKGLPLQPYQEQYVDAENVWIADKKDGISAKLVYSHKSFTIVTPHQQPFKIKLDNESNGSWTGPEFMCFILMVELIPSQSTHGHALLETMPYWIVVTDVIVAPWGSTGSFIARWKWLELLYAAHSWPFVLQKWYNLRDPDVLILLDKAEEGVVVQNLLASPGSLKHGAGSAMYVKRKYTIDRRLHDGSVGEFDLDGNYIRPRPDKVKGNPESVIAIIKTAVNYNVFCLYVLTKYYGTIGANWSELLENVRISKPISEWSIESKLLFFANRHHERLSKVNPDLMRTLNMKFSLHCVDHVPSISPVSASVEDYVEEDPVFLDFEEVKIRESPKMELKAPSEGFWDLYEKERHTYPTRGLFPTELNNYVWSFKSLKELSELIKTP